MAALLGIGRFFLTPLGLKVLGAIAALLLLLGVYHHVWHNGYVKGEAEIQKDWDADKAMRIRAFSNAMEKYVTAQEEAERNAQQLEAERQKRISDAKLRALNLPPADAGARFPGSAIGVLNDAAGNPAPVTGSSAQPAKSPAEDSTAAIVTQWAVDVIGWYNECRDEVIGLQTFYHALQQSQPEVKP